MTKLVLEILTAQYKEDGLLLLFTAELLIEQLAKRVLSLLKKGTHIGGSVIVSTGLIVPTAALAMSKQG